MRTPTTLPPAILAGVAFAALAASGDTTYVQKPSQAQPAAAVTTLGQPASAKWTATTYEAATSEANKKVLESGRPTTVTGEVVDVSCYLQLGKRGEAHLDCGSKCIRSGQPIGLLEEDGDLYLLMAEEHHPRRDGMTDLGKAFLPLLAKTVAVSGMEVEANGYRALFVSAEELGVMKKAQAAAKGGKAVK
jgi:hypothetical protein